MSERTPENGRGPAGGYPPPSYPPPAFPPPAYPGGYAVGTGPDPVLTVRQSFPHPEPTPYHLMLRTWSYAWWKPVLGLLLAVLGMLVVAPVVLLPVLAGGIVLSGGPFWQSFLEAATLQRVDPAGLLYLNLVLGSLILVTWAVMRVMHRMRPRWLSSVAPRIRWRFLLVCLAIAVVALLAQVVVGLFLPGDTESDLGTLNEFTRTTAVLALIVLLTTPFQAAGEEYLFRGYALMAVGSLFGSKWVAIVGTALIFAAAHGSQNFPLFFDRFVFGLIAAWLVIRTGGLEAGIALHVLNNFLAFGFALSFGDLTESLTIAEVSWWNIPLTLTQSGLYAVLVVLVARRWGLQTRTLPPAVPGSEPARPGPVPQPV